MAQVLAADEEITRVSFADIQKWEEGPDGTLYVYGRASTPEVDTDEQIVSSSFSGKALQDWLNVAPALRVQHNPQRDPAGSGVKVEVNRDGDGAHWVKAVVDEPVAARLVKKGHLRAFSIGIAKPVIERDMSGKARGGVITAGKIVEVSLVDSPANRSCFLELAKADKSGAPEFTGKVFGAGDFLTKAAPADDAPVNVDLPKSATITFSPGDLNKLLEHRRLAAEHLAAELPAFRKAANAEAKILGKKSRNFSAERRSDLAHSGNALPDGCLSGETLIATPVGPQRIDSLLGECTVLTDCGWEQAEVRSFGIKPLFAVTLTRGAERQTVYATAGHRWLTDQGEWVLTGALIPGIRVPHVKVLTEGVPADALDVTKGRVAPDAQQAPDSPRDVIVVDLESRPAHAFNLAAAGNLRDLAANRASSSLAGFESLEVGLSDAVLATQNAIAPGHPARTPELDFLATHSSARTHAEFAVSAPEFSWGAYGEVGVRAGRVTGPADDVSLIGEGHAAHLLVRAGAAVGLAEAKPAAVAGVAPAVHGLRALRRTSAIGAGLKRHVSNYTRFRTWEVVSVEATPRAEEVFCAVVPDLHRFALASGILTGNSYPIPDKDALRRAAILARSGHGNVEAARKLIARRARELGVNNPLDDNEPADGAEKSVDTAPEAMAVKDAEPDDQPDSMPEAAPPEAVKADGGDPHEPVLHHDDGEDDDTDSDADANEKAAQAGYQAAREHLTVKYGWTPEQLDALPGEAIAAIIAAEKAAEPDAEKADMPAKPPKMPCPKCKAMCKPKAKFCGKCGCPMMAEKADKPTPGDGVTGAAAAAVEPVPAHREPDGPAFEALEHDAGLPTVPDASVKTAVKMSELGVPNQEGMLHDLLCPAYPGASVKAAWPGADLSLVDEQGWQAKAFEAATTAPLGEFQQAAEKASQAWTAARILKSVPSDLYEEVMDEAHKAFRDANPGPGSAPQPGEMSAQRYNRPYITAGHSAPSPDHDGPNRSPIHPEHISASDFSRGLITDGHAADSPENDMSRPEPVPAPAVPGVPTRVFYSNTQRQNAAQAMRAMHDHIAQTFPDLCPMHGPGRMGEPPSHARPVAAGVGGPVPHGASKAADADEAVTDEAAARAARKAAKRERRQRELIDAIVKQVQDGLIPAGEIRDAGGVVKAAVPGSPAPLAPAVAATADADLIKAALAPVLDELAEQKRMLDAIASQPDPAVTAYRGAAIAKTSAAPAGPLTVPQRAEHAQDTAYRAMYEQWRGTSDPDQRERAYTYLMGASGLIPRPPS